MEQLPLLQTKLFIPPARSDLVSRPRLIARLNAGLERQLSVISAPAGFGKTTLVSEWAHRLRAGRGAVTTPLPDAPHEAPPQIAWLSLDEGDNDPARFLSYVIAALRTTEAELASGVLSALQSHQPPPPAAILSTLINELTTLPGSIILILDDYHLIEAREIHDALAFLLDHLPPQMHLVIATREDPHLPLARLRARGQLIELRASELRFTSSEAAEFLNQVMGLDLSSEDAAALEARTEGWIAGLHLAALSIQGRPDRSGLIDSFTGSHRFVLDYLIEEVLEQQPATTQTCLLQTSVLDRLTAPLCEAVCLGLAEGTDRSERAASSFGTADVDAGSSRGSGTRGQVFLETLDRANLFIVPLDQERRWYRYHHLFADLLRRRLRRSHPELVPTLHHRASQWYELNGFPNEAIEHAVRAGELEWAAHLLEQHADALWGRGEHTKFRRWLEELPADLALSRPHLCIYYAWYQFVSGQPDAAEKSLQAAELALGSGAEEQEEGTLAGPNRSKLRGRVAAVRAFMVSHRGDVPGIIHYAGQALEHLPEQDRTWRSLSAIALGDAHGFKGDMSAAYKARLEALQACRATGDPYYNMLAGIKVAITLRAQGRLQQTIELCRELARLATESGLSQTSLAGLIQLIWSEVLAELDDLDGALDRADTGMGAAELAFDMAMLGWAYMCLARLRFSRGEFAGIQEIINRIENTDREFSVPPWITGQMESWQVRIWLAQGNAEKATQWAGDRGLLAQEPQSLPPLDFFTLMEYILFARILNAQGQQDRATDLLQPLLEAAEAGDRRSSAIEILGLQALAFEASGDTTQAMSVLERALTLAEPEGFVRTFVDEGPPMEQLLRAAAARGIMPGYTAHLLAAFEGTTKDSEPGSVVRRMPASASSPVPSTAEGLVEPLSERELEVLQLIAEGLTNREIASRLFVSLNTVKAHTRNIYGKLGVHSRTKAAARARDLGLLPSI